MAPRHTPWTWDTAIKDGGAQQWMMDALSSQREMLTQETQRKNRMLEIDEKLANAEAHRSIAFVPRKVAWSHRSSLMRARP